MPNKSELGDNISADVLLTESEPPLTEVRLPFTDLEAQARQLSPFRLHLARTEKSCWTYPLARYGDAAITHKRGCKHDKDKHH
jgi:hypothetical protein